MVLFSTILLFMVVKSSLAKMLAKGCGYVIGGFREFARIR